MSEMQEALDQIAITGMAGRFPGARDVAQFWDNLTQGREGIARLSTEELVASGVDPALVARDGYVPALGVLDGADMFDARFFGYSPREAEVLDPQHRVLLECAFEALQDAGCVPEEFDGRIGVFAGAALNTYLLFNVLANRRVFESVGQYQVLQASDKDFLATRVAYKLGLRGPAITVQTACSTSLTAVHLACQSLLNGECDIALAGGVTVSSPLRQGYLYEPGGISSPDGHCRPFDAGAAGTVPGNGVGMVVLRRLGDALDAGDAVAAVILGTAVNNDGSRKAGYTAPSVEGQAGVISEALAVAGVGAESIGYVEAHGTATALGDPIEIAALTRAFREYTDAVGYCAIGSVKSNIGHLDAAAGVTSLIKTVLMLQHGAIPPSLHFSEANPELKLDSSPFQVAGGLRPWPRSDTPRRAGVSSFGIGGTNVHLVLQEAPDGQPARNVPGQPGGTAAAVRRKAAGTPRTGSGEPTDRPVLLPLSAKVPDALVDAAGRLADHLDAYPGTDLAAVARTLGTRRRAFGYRSAVVCRDREEAVTALRRIRAGDAVAAAERAPHVAFLFPGQGAQYAGMAGDLYRHEPVFAAEVDRCATLFATELGLDLRELLFAAPDDAAGARLAQTEITQPVMFLVEYALARLWMARGVRPSAMVGHSIGEYVAACLAGVFSLEDAVRLVAARGRLVGSMPPGAMLTVFLPEQEVAGLLDGGLSLAAVNSTGLCVVSGPYDAVDGLAGRLADAGVSCRRLHTSHAFHSPAMDAAVAPLTALVGTVALHAPTIPFCSNLTGTWITDEQATSAGYWGRHLRATVRFADAVQALLADPSMVFVEVGPGHTLTNFVRSHAGWDPGRTAVTSLRHAREHGDDRVYLLRGLAGVWNAGVGLDSGVFGPDGATAVRLPTYPFQRQRYWVTPDADAVAATRAPDRGAGARFYSPGWHRLPPRGDPAGVPMAAGVPLWLVLGGGTGLSRSLVARLAGEGRHVVPVAEGTEVQDLGDGSWSVDPADRDQLAQLLAGLAEREPAELRIVHTVSLDADPAARLDDQRLRRARRAGFDSLLALAQAIERVRPAAPIAIDVLCRGVYEVTGEEPLQPENATLIGACTVIPQEVAGVACRLLDVTGPDPDDPAGPAVDAVVHALVHPTGHRELALRGRHWWYRDFDAVPLPADGSAPSPRLRDHGVYLITGGLGGMGLAMAEHLAGQVDGPHLALLGRSEFPAEDDWDAWLAGHPSQDPTSARITRLRRLRERGAQIVLCRADVTDAEQTTAQVRRLRERFGAIHGVIHAAGLPGTGMITGKTAADVDRVLDPKVRGSVVLDEALDGEPLDFFLLCSSVNSILGGTGQSDYGAANAFLDAFAHWKRRQGVTAVTALDWGRWDGVGMATLMEGRADPAGEPTRHPLLRRVATGGRAVTYASRFTTADSWIVDDHRLMGHGLIPGTAFLELVRAALAERAGDQVIQLHDVLFIAPVTVPDGQARTVYTTLDDHDGRVSFTVRSRDEVDGSWRDNATGWASFAPRAEPPVRDLAAIRDACRREVVDSEEAILRRARAERWTDGELRFRVGPRWRVLHRLELGDKQLLATLSLPGQFVTDLDDYPLHPAMLDMAVGVFRLDAKDPYYLPLSYGTLRVLRPLTPTIYCHAWRSAGTDGSGETLTCDLELLDPDGQVLVQVSGYSVKRINDVPTLMTQITRSVEAAQRAGADRDGTEADEPVLPAILRSLMRGMSEAEAVDAFARVLAAGQLPGQLVVSSGDFAELRELAGSLTPELLARELAQVAPPADSHPRPELDTPYVPPRTDRERAVAAVWRDVLGVEPVGVDDDFFALGGHSLAAVQISTRIRGQLGLEVDLRRFFDTPTVAHLAALLEERSGSAVTEVIEVIDRGAGDIDLDDLDGLSDDEVDARLRELLAEDTGDLR